MKQLKHIFRLHLAIATTMLSFSGICQAQARLLALSKTDHTLSIVDPLSLKVLSKIPVGIDPHEVVASADGKYAYVSIYGGGSFHQIDVIDLVNRKPVNQFDTRPFYGPHGLDFVDGKLWLTVEGSKAVARYNPESGKIDWCMGTGQDRTHMIYVVPGGKKIYTTNVASGTVSILTDTTLRQEPGSTGALHVPGNRPAPFVAREDWKQSLVPTAPGAEGFDVAPDGRELWTASADNGTIYIIDLSGKKVASTIRANVIGANRLKFSPDGSRVLVSSLRTGDLSVFDARTRRLIKRIPLGHGAAGILMDPANARAFVACTPDNYIAVVDLKTLSVTGHIQAGGGPDGLAWAVLASSPD